MSKVSILDCTLRDGGYINQWRFGEETISGIIVRLETAGIDIIECGFLRDIPYVPDTAVYSDVAQIKRFIGEKTKDRLYVAMIALGDIDPERIGSCDGKSIDGIRLTFHKHEWEEAKRAAQILQNKGYLVFIQPVGTTSYSDEELLYLIRDVNQLHPYAFYLVDTLGIMYRRDLLRLYYLIDNNLDDKIQIGFHSHNNLQLSFANAQELLRIHDKRMLIIDSSVYGMGRGAGNLSTELLAEYMNENMGTGYGIISMLAIADEYLMSVFAEHRWGYAFPYFLSSRAKCHPNYAHHLMNKQTLSIENISKVLSLLPEKLRDLYHPDLIEELYTKFQSCDVDDSESLSSLKAMLYGKEVLVLAPGRSVREHKNILKEVISAQYPIVIAVNFIPEDFKYDILFVSNQKRMNMIRKSLEEHPCLIATSNLKGSLPANMKNLLLVNYTDYLGDGYNADNAAAMLIRLLNNVGVSKIFLAGIDGYDTNMENFYIDSYESVLSRNDAEKKNKGIAFQLRESLSGMSYQCLTPTRYQI